MPFCGLRERSSDFEPRSGPSLTADPRLLPDLILATFIICQVILGSKRMVIQKLPFPNFIFLASAS